MTIEEAHTERARIDKELDELVSDREAWKIASTYEFLKRSERMVVLTGRYIEIANAMTSGTVAELATR